MSKILVLALTGFGKSLSAAGCQEPENGINIEGLPRDNTYFISATSKPLPFRGSARVYPVVVPDTNMTNLHLGRRIITNDAYVAAKAITALCNSPLKNIVIDDAQYYMMDYMASKSLATGWDAPKKVGHFMSEMFAAIELAEQYGKNIWMLAHYDEKKKDNQGNVTFKMKTTGNAVEAGVDPEGKFDITLYGKIEANAKEKKVTRYFITNNDGTFNAKSAPGMLPFAIPNDLGYVLKCLDAYYNGDPTPQSPVDLSELASVEIQKIAMAAPVVGLPATTSQVVPVEGATGAALAVDADGFPINPNTPPPTAAPVATTPAMVIVDDVAPISQN